MWEVSRPRIEQSAERAMYKGHPYVQTNITGLNGIFLVGGHVGKPMTFNVWQASALLETDCFF